DGYQFKSVACTKNGAPLTVDDARTITIPGLKIDDEVNCDFKNQIDTGELRVRKVFVGAPTSVSLQINAQTKITGDSQTFQTALVPVPAPRTHQVAEVFANAAAAALYDSTYICRENGDTNPVASGSGTVVANGVLVRPGAVVTCTFFNRHDISLG